MGTPQDVHIFSPEKPASTGSVSTHQDYGQQLPISHATQTNTFPRTGKRDAKTSMAEGSSYSAAAKRGESYGTMGKIPHGRTDNRPNFEGKHDILPDDSARNAKTQTKNSHWTANKFPHGKVRNELELEEKAVHVPGKPQRKSARVKGHKPKAEHDVASVSQCELKCILSKLDLVVQ